MSIKILYVEDEPFLGRIVTESLQSRSYDVLMIPDGRVALKEFQRYLPDICVLDVMLPNKDGFTIAKEIRTVAPDVPIIFVTAKTQTMDVVKGFETGGNDYIRKPFSMEELIVRIKNLLNTRSQHAKDTSASYKVGKYEFLPGRYELRLGDDVRKLSYRETTLLEMLAQSQNNTVLRKTILLKIWGDDSFFNSRNLDVYIRKLRDYLKDDPSIQIITIKGVGYTFVSG